MKKIAILLLLIFTTVQAVPGLFSLFSPDIPVFVVDELQGEDKTEAEKKNKKDFACFTSLSAGYSHKLNTVFHLAEKIHPSPCLEKLTPPPNFS